MKIAFFSDLHIGVHKNSTEWHKIALQWCDWFCKQCYQHNVDHIIFCGDLFHHRDSIDVRSLNVADAIVKKISNEYNVSMIVGNHDCYYKDKGIINSLKQWKDIKNLDIFFNKIGQDENDWDYKVIGNNNECKIIYAPWGSDLYKLPGGDILIAHCELNNFKLNNNRISDCKLEANTILDKIPVAFIGHIHTRSERSYGNDKKIIYVGNPYEMDFNDEGNTKGIYIYDTISKDITFIENTISPKHKKIFASKVDSIKSEELNNTIVKLVVDKQLNDDELTQIKSKISTSSPFYIADTDYIDNFKNLQTEDGEYDISGNSTLDVYIEEFIDKLDVEYKEEIKQKVLESYKQYND